MHTPPPPPTTHTDAHTHTHTHKHTPSTRKLVPSRVDLSSWVQNCHSKTVGKRKTADIRVHLNERKDCKRKIIHMSVYMNKRTDCHYHKLLFRTFLKTNTMDVYYPLFSTIFQCTSRNFSTERTLTQVRVVRRQFLCSQ